MCNRMALWVYGDPAAVAIAEKDADANVLVKPLEENNDADAGLRQGRAAAAITGCIAVVSYFTPKFPVRERCSSE